MSAAPYPNFADKHAHESIVTPAQSIKYALAQSLAPEELPLQGAILCYERSLMRHIIARHRTSPLQEVHEFLRHLHLLPETKNTVGVIGEFGIGAPAAVRVLEGLIVLGVRRFISIGTAGSLQRHLGVGAIVVCDKAIRDEGTSHHYLPPARYADASPAVVARITQALERRGLPYQVGPSWTIDAPYRETVEEVQRYQAEGVATVEMEAAALFAVAQYRGVEMGALFTISDVLADLAWDPQFDHEKTTGGLESIYQVALDVLTADGGGT